ncbi:MAG TPA: hypothetical protein VN888_01190 [Mycobacterium sp.]|nr:hypothetical protein [Mycobacterium sp.]
MRLTSTLRAAIAASGIVVLIAGCGTNSMHSTNHGTTNTSTLASVPAPSGMPGMTMPGMTEPMPAGDGLAAAQSGFTLVPATTTIPANTATTFTFRITGPDRAPVTQFVPEQTKLLHFYLIRSDLSSFDHLHPTMAADSTWSTTLPAMAPGSWRAYTQFAVHHPGDVTVPLVLSTPLTVPGEATLGIPPPSSTATIDGYTVTVSGQPIAGQESQLTLDFSSNGLPITDLQPYLDTYAHVTAIHAANLAFAHLHPTNTVNGSHGGPKLTIESALPASGDWRLFIEFQTAGTVHTAQMTLRVG